MQSDGKVEFACDLVSWMTAPCRGHQQCLKGRLQAGQRGQTFGLRLTLEPALCVVHVTGMDALQPEVGQGVFGVARFRKHLGWRTIMQLSGGTGEARNTTAHIS